jgi:hypothetical protein
MRRSGKILPWILRAAGLCALLAVSGCWLITNPVLVDLDAIEAPAADSDRLEADVRDLATRTPSRTSRNVAALDAVADWIGESFAAAGCAPRERTYETDGATYRNVICAFGPEGAPRLVIGAHYDVFEGPGADDNASGVAAILELARLIGAAEPELAHRLELVAFTLEEPPHFRRETMGSYVHAGDIAEAGTALKLMISVEMVGYFSDAPGSQTYPAGFLEWFYPDRADFIGVVGRTFDRTAVNRVKALMAAAGALPVYSINAPVRLAGIDFSDHWSFWQHGLPAVMVTDTAFFRNPNYHRPTDTPDTLDYRRMAQVVDGLYQVAVGY